MMAHNQKSEQQGANEGPFSGYAPDEDFPLGAYAGFVAAYNLGLVPFLRHLDRSGRLPERLSLGDAILLGLATHKLTRVVARDWVTSPLRAPFVRYQAPAPGGEVEEEPRGRGWRRAVGELITCPFCMGPWVAGGLMLGLAVRPRITRTIMGIFAAVTASDFLHRAYALLESRRNEMDAFAEQLRSPESDETFESPPASTPESQPIEDAQVVGEERR